MHPIPSTGCGTFAPDALNYHAPGQGPCDSFPLGNGDIAANVWSTPDGGIYVQPAKTDAWDESMRLLKLGQIHLAADPSLDPCQWDEQFDAATATWSVKSGNAQVRIWIDAHAPVMWIELESEAPRVWSAKWTQWRTKRRELTGQESHSATGLEGGPIPAEVWPDHKVKEDENETIWLHANRHTLRDFLLTQQGLGDWIEREPDPIADLVFGGRLRRHIDGSREYYSLTLLTLQGTTEAWLEALALIVPGDPIASRAAHEAWWSDFWSRSGMEVSGFSEADKLTQAVALHRYVVACCGRGCWPVKFNGACFTTDWEYTNEERDEDYDADYRRWGGGYWFQNTRLTYWPLLASGDHEMLQPFFRLYLNLLPFFEHRARTWFGHSGAFVPEVITLWGTYLGRHYGWNRDGKAVHDIHTPFVKRYWTAGLEFSFILLDYAAFTDNATFLKEQALPFIRSILTFYREHFPERDEQGRFQMTHAQCIEMWNDTTNPTPDLAGLHAVLQRVVALPEWPDHERAEWQAFRAILPPLPKVATDDGHEVLAPAQHMTGEAMNTENPELYAVFPFRCITNNHPDADLARRAFLGRKHTHSFGWHQHVQQAALLGLTNEAEKALLQFLRAPNPGRFPAFWGPNLDWIPDLDHGANMVFGLQTMLLQWEAEHIKLLPAWPRHWNVRFRLHAPKQTVVDGEWRDGEWAHLDITPASRARDVVTIAGSEFQPSQNG